MPNEKDKQSKPEVVRSIFDRSSKKSISALFTHKSAKATPTSRDEKKPSEKSAIKKLFPFGLDIGSDSIKIMQLARGIDGGTKIAKLIIEELPRQAQQNQKERSYVPADMLKKIVEDNGLKGDCFVTAPSGLSKIHFIKLPKMPLNEVEKAVQWEIKHVTNQDLNEISWDYVVLENQKSGFLSDMTGTLIITAPKKDIFEYLAFLESIRLNPQALDVESLTNVAAFDFASSARPEEVVLFLDFGAGKTSLSIICNRELISTRAITVTGNFLTKAVSEYCKVPWVGAEALKKTFGIATPSASQDAQESSDKALQVKNAILLSLENVVQDIEHTFKYFSYQITQSRITAYDRLVLSGGSAYLKGFIPFLRDRLNVEIDIINSLNRLNPLESNVKLIDPSVLENYGVDNIEALSPVFNIAVGLALRGLE